MTTNKQFSEVTYVNGDSPVNHSHSHVSTLTVTSGHSSPLGATVYEHGINFALFSANAEKVELCIFDASGKQEIHRIELPEFTDEVWYGFVEGLPAGTLYGYRVYGPFAPHDGHRFNHHKLLLDPYAKQLFGEYIESRRHYAFDEHCPETDLTLDISDNADYLPKCVAVNTLKPLNSHPGTRRRDAIIYEMHVKGFTKLHPDVPIELRGTFAGLAQPSVCQYLADLGITSIELLPVHSFLDEPFVKDKGLSNYWGYNSLNFFVPHPSYCHSGEISEFQQMVEALHQAGIEVILDVVYNHTAEGNELGPTICYKGIDNASYYRLCDESKRYYVNHSGCGNTLNISHPRVLQLVADSLRYWVEVMGVDGFRFDLASVLGRGKKHFSASNHFFTVLKQDPTLAKVKLIAEPWDIGDGGYQLGRFPNQWQEWNDRFRDTCRRFWRGDQGIAPEFAARIHGSSDIFAPNIHEKTSRRPCASVNFITSHDGFTLADLVSYEQRHNEANGELNRDGHGGNFSCNHGAEGDTADEAVLKLRQQQKRNLLTTLFVSQGTPMLLAGDEMGNSQQGNNNAYCQDNEISWLDWHNLDAQAEIDFVKRLIYLRKEHPLLNRTHYQHGHTVAKHTLFPDISWLNCRGQRIHEGDWHNSAIKCVAMLLADTDSEILPEIDTVFGEFCPLGHPHDEAILIIFNAHQKAIEYALPALDGHWQVLINTVKTIDFYNDKSSKYIMNTTITVAAHSCVVLSFSSLKVTHKISNNKLTPVSKLDKE